LAPRFIDEVLHIDAYDAVLNYGLNKVRFPAPVPVGAKIRAVITLVSAQERAGGTVEAASTARGSWTPRRRPPRHGSRRA
jgi:acyl dehydratase